MLAAHHAGDGLNPIVVGDHDIVGDELIGLAVERQYALAFARAAHNKTARDFLCVEHMQRATAIKGEVIGDVDQRVDGAQADGLQPLLHPVRRGAVLDAAHEPQGEGRRQMRVLRGQIKLHGDRAGESPRDRLDRAILQPAQTGGCQIARDAVHARRIGAIGREIDVDHRVREPGEIHIARANRRVFGKLHDAVMIA